MIQHDDANHFPAADPTTIALAEDVSHWRPMPVTHLYPQPHAATATTVALPPHMELRPTSAIGENFWLVAGYLSAAVTLALVCALLLAPLRSRFANQPRRSRATSTGLPNAAAHR